MSDEVKDFNKPADEQETDEDALESEAEEEESAPEASAVKEAFEKSPEEIAAEEAMLAEMERMSEGDEESEDEDVSSDGIEPFEPGNAEKTKNLELLMDVSLQITVELGRRDMRFGEVLQLGKGSLVELNKIADEPVDIYVNQSKIAEGEVVVVDDHFGVRITKLLNPDRLKRFA